MPFMEQTPNVPDVCWHREVVQARKGSTGKEGKATVGAPCGRALRNGRCPKHGADTLKKAPKELS